MVTSDELLTFCDRALDGYAVLARELGDARVSTRPPGLDGANTAYGLIAHVAGVMGYWGPHRR